MSAENLNLDILKQFIGNYIYLLIILLLFSYFHYILLFYINYYRK